MSLKPIKTKLEQYLNANLTTVAIKFKNTDTYMLNGVVLTDSQASALIEFVQPNVTSLSSDIELMSTNEDVNFLSLFEFLVYTKKGEGTGGLYEIADTLRTMFKKQNISGIQTYNFSYEDIYSKEDFEILPCSVVCKNWGV